MRDRFLRRLVFIAVAALLGTQLSLRGLAHINPFDPLASVRPAQPAPTHSAPMLTDRALRHITTGDSHGGGHMAGQNAPCKSEFPVGWDAEKIGQTVSRLAANDNLDWQTEGNGYQTAHARDGKLDILIVVNPRRNEIVTAYPVNVPRNPCPRAANDNRPDERD